jgi:opacity protein-like surface antigen
MRVSLKLSLAAAATAVLMCGAARADAPDEASGGPAVGVGMICNTSEQAEQFVALRAQGTETKQAMQTVNEQAHDPRACGVAAIAFIRDATLDTKAVNDKLLQVVRINVVAGFDGSDWQRVADMVQYAVMEGEGEAI